MTRSTIALAEACAESRRALLAFADTPLGEITLAIALHITTGTITERSQQELLQTMYDVQRVGLGGADLYVADDLLCQLVQEAAPSLPEQTLSTFDAPSDTGYVYFATPLRLPEAPGGTYPSVAAISWQKVNGVKGVGDTRFFVFIYTESSGFTGRQAPRAADLEPGMLSVHDLPDLVPVHEFHWEIGSTPNNSEDGRAGSADMHRLLTTFWTLAKQDLTATHSAPQGNRALRRRTQRLGVDRANTDRPVRVLRLQHYAEGEAAASSPPTDPEGSASTGEDRATRLYHHQWIVRGFWRNTWFPSLGIHRSQWIAPHVRGPKDKPLLGGEKVFLVRGQRPVEGKD